MADSNEVQKLKTSIVVDAELWGRFRVELMRRSQEASFSKGVEAAISSWLESPDSSRQRTISDGSTDPSITPKSDFEHKIVQAVLLFLEQEKNTPQLIALLETLLKDQLTQLNAGSEKPTKRRA